MSILVGITGGSGSGKTSLVAALAKRLAGRVAVLEYDWYYRDQRERSMEERLKTNYDHPDALEENLLLEHLEQLRAGKMVAAPQYDFVSHVRMSIQRRITPAPILLLEGIHALTSPTLRAQMDLSVFIDVPADLRFIRRLQRDVRVRERSMESVVAQYLHQTRPMYEEFVAPVASQADFRISGLESPDECARQVCAEIEKRFAL